MAQTFGRDSVILFSVNERKGERQWSEKQRKDEVRRQGEGRRAER